MLTGITAEGWTKGLRVGVDRDYWLRLEPKG